MIAVIVGGVLALVVARESGMAMDVSSANWAKHEWGRQYAALVGAAGGTGVAEALAQAEELGARLRAAGVALPQVGRLHGAVLAECAGEAAGAQATRVLEACLAGYAAAGEVDRDSAAAGGDDAFRRLADHVPEAIIRLDRNLRHVYVNAEVERVFGWPQAVFLGKRNTELAYPPEAVAQWDAILERVVATGQEEQTQFRLETPTGLRHYQAQVLPEFGADGRVETVLVVSRDVTAFKQTEAELQRHREDLEELIAQRTRELAVANEQLRTELRERRQAEHLLRLQRDLAVVLGSVTDLAAGLARVLEAGLSIEGIDAGGIYVRNPETGELRLATYRNLSPEFAELVAYYGPDAPEARQVAEGRVVNQPLLGPGRTLTAAEREGLRSLIAIPILHRGEVLGALNLASRQLDVLPEPTRHAAESIAAHVGAMMERVRAEMTLRESEERYRLLADNASDMISRVDAAGAFFYASPACQALLGYRPEELCGRSTYDLFHPDDRGALQAYHQAVLNDLPRGVLTHRMQRRDGSYGWYEATARAVRDGRGMITEIIAVTRDITARRRAEEALRDSEALFRTMAQITPVSVSIIQDGRVVYANEAASRMLGYTPEELLARAPWDFVHASVRDALRQQLVDRLAGRPVPARYELRMVTHDGRELWVDNSVAMLEYRGQRAVLVAGVDLTARKRADEEARCHQEQLAHVARVSTMGEMTSGVAHELAQPLSAILYFARSCESRLQAGGWGVAEAVATLQKIAVQAERAGEFIRRMKAFIRKAEPVRITAELNRIVQEALNLAGAEAQTRQVRLRTELAAAVPAVVVDPIQIEQVILNLVRNSIEALAPLPPAQREVWVQSCVRATGRVEVHVRDGGPGIPASVAEHLFDPFFTTKSHGLGLGLPISRSIVEAHEGKLRLQSAAAGATEFVFDLPTAGREAHGIE